MFGHKQPTFGIPSYQILPPVPVCLGVEPSHAANCLPESKSDKSVAVATNAIAVMMGCKRLDQTHHFLPGYNNVHRVEDHAFAGALHDKLKSGGGKADLFMPVYVAAFLGCHSSSEFPHGA